MPPPSARVRTGAQSRSFRAQSGRSENPALIWLLAVAIWIPIVTSAVDFDGLAVLQEPRGGTLAPNPVMRTLKIGLIVIGTLVILSHMREARALLKRVNVFFLVFLLLAITSITWSADPSATLARYISFSATVLVSFAFCLVGWHGKRFQNVVRPLLTLLLLGSLIYIILMPDYAIDFDKAGYHGLATQKNPFGELCALGTLLWMHGWISGEAKSFRSPCGRGARIDLPLALEERHVSTRHCFCFLADVDALAHLAGNTPIYPLLGWVICRPCCCVRARGSAIGAGSRNGVAWPDHCDNGQGHDIHQSRHDLEIIKEHAQFIRFLVPGTVHIGLEPYLRPLPTSSWVACIFGRVRPTMAISTS